MDKDVGENMELTTTTYNLQANMELTMRTLTGVCVDTLSIHTYFLPNTSFQGIELVFKLNQWPESSIQHIRLQRAWKMKQSWDSP